MTLDNRTWLAWGIAMSLPALIGRNPFVLAELLIIAITVRSLITANQEWGWVLRVISIFVTIGVVFNVLTVHSGDRVLTEIPDGVPLIGGAITLNAVIFGVVSGLAIFTIVLVWTQVAAHLSWSMLMRQVPHRFAHIAVAGSVAWSYLPSMRRTLRDIRESQMSRGWHGGRLRDLPALIVPVLAGGLERAIVTSEVLETRGFGGHSTPRRSNWSSVRLLGGMVSLISGLYCLAVGLTVAAGVLGLTGVIALAIESRQESDTTRPTRLRESGWSSNDTLCTSCAIGAAIVIIATFVRDSSFLTFNPYPTLETPPVDILLMGSLLLLFAPAVISVTSTP